MIIVCAFFFFISLALLHPLYLTLNIISESELYQIMNFGLS